MYYLYKNLCLCQNQSYIEYLYSKKIYFILFYFTKICVCGFLEKFCGNQNFNQISTVYSQNKFKKTLYLFIIYMYIYINLSYILLYIIIYIIYIIINIIIFIIYIYVYKYMLIYIFIHLSIKLFILNPIKIYSVDYKLMQLIICFSLNDVFLLLSLQIDSFLLIRDYCN